MKKEKNPYYDENGMLKVRPFSYKLNSDDAEGISNEYNCNSSYDNTIKLQNTYPHCAEIPAIESIYQERIKELEECITRMRHEHNAREHEFRRQYQHQERRYREEIERVRNETKKVLPF